MPRFQTAKLPNPTDKHVGRRVRMRRKMLSMSQTKLADALGLTFQQIQKYEKGTNRMGASRLLQISRVLRVPISFFFVDPRGPSEGAGTQPAPSPGSHSDFLTTTDGLVLTKAFMVIRDPKLRRSIVNLVREIARADDVTE